HAFMPMHNYIYLPTRTPWPAGSVNSRIPPIQVGIDADGEPVMLTASQWLDCHHPVEQMTWVPGLPELIRDRLVFDGGWIERDGFSCLNLYHPPAIIPGNFHRADKWVEHVGTVYPEDAGHILDWLAHRVQRPCEKINHALVLGGS